MSEKKDALTLATVRMHPISTALVPDAGYDDMTFVENECRDARQELTKSVALTGASFTAGIVGAFFTSILAFSSPFFAPLYIMMSLGLIGTIIGTGTSTVDFLRLTRANKMRALPPGLDEEVAHAEGAAHALIDALNTRSRKWNEGWDTLTKEEENLFLLKDRCESKKSLRGLIRRIELVRKEKQKFLKVRAKLESERAYILRGIESMQKRLDQLEKPPLLEDGE